MNALYPKPIDPTRTRVGWVGIGVIGAAMASRLLSAGYTVTVYARNPSKALHLQSIGAKLARSLHDLVQSSDVIFTVIGGPSDVRQVVLENLIPSISPNTVLVDHTTSYPILAKQIFDFALERNCHSVDAPVSGGDIGARDGKLAIFAGGSEDVVKWLKPLFDEMGKVTYVGGPGMGQHCKLANQITGGANLLGLSEGLVFAEKAGIDKSKFLEAVKGGAAGSMVMELFGERMIRRDFEPGGYAEYMVKDMGMGLDAGTEEGDDVMALPGAALCRQLFVGMVANGNGKLGTQGLITVIENMNTRTH